MSETYTCNKYYGDVYGRTEKVTVDRRLEKMPYAQAGVVYEPDGGNSLISYATKVATVDGEGFLTCGGTYSATTRRHIGRWIQEFNSPADYYICKQAAEENWAINIYTGEILTMEEYLEHLRERREGAAA